jgi:signal recognition particle receptor subunit alpha
MLQLTYAEDLLSAVKSVFLALYQPFLTNFVSSLHGGRVFSAHAGGDEAHRERPLAWSIPGILLGWDKTFDKILKSIEDKVAQDRKSRLKGNGTLAQSVSASKFSATSADQEATSEFSYLLRLLILRPAVNITSAPSKEAEARHDPNEISRNVEALKNRLKNSTAAPRRGRRRAAKSNRVKDSPSATECAPAVFADEFFFL